MNSEEQGFYMDVAEYGNNYKERNQILRLIHIAKHCLGPMYDGDMELRALQVAYDLLRGEYAVDLGLFRSIAERIDGRLGEYYLLDEDFHKERNIEFHSKLQGYIDSLERAKVENDEAGKIRFSTLAYNLAYDCGFLHDEFKPFELRDKLIEGCMKTVLVALETGEFGEARHRTQLMEDYYSREEGYRYKMDCASALADLGEKKYYDAAEGFVRLFPIVHRYDYSEVVTSEDIITYGLVCAMATFDVAKLLGALDKLVEPTGVLLHLRSIIKPYGLVHSLTRIIQDSLDGRRTTFSIESMPTHRPRLLADMYLFEHVDYLLSEIRDVMLSRFIGSFSTTSAADQDHFTFSMVEPQNGNEERRIVLDSGHFVVTESEIIRLIETNKIQGRIDNSNGSRVLRCRKWFSKRL